MNSTNTTIAGGAGGTINDGTTGGTGGTGVILQGNTSFANLAGGTIQGGAGVIGWSDGGTGILFQAGGTLTNQSGAQIIGGTTVQGQGGVGAVFQATGSLTNEAGATISGGSGGFYTGGNAFGVSFSGGNATLSNAGTINGGVSMGNYANSVTLLAGGVINGDLNMGNHTGSTLILTGSGTQTYSSAVNGTTSFNGSLRKQGAGTWTLNQALNPSGGTTIEGGNLKVTNSLGGSVAVNANTTLGGTGTIHGNVIIENQGTLYPGDPSVLTVNGSVTFNTGAKSAFAVANTVTPNPPQKVTAGIDYDQVSLRDGSSTGNLTIQSGVTLEVLNLSFLQLNPGTYNPTAPNTDITNYFLFSLQTGNTTGRFDLFSDGITSKAINYSAGIGNVTFNTTEIFISYTGNSATNSTLGGQDVVISAYNAQAVPEPSTWLLLFIGAGIIYLLKLSKSKTPSDHG